MSSSRLTRERGEAKGGGVGNSQRVEPILAMFEKHDGNPREERGFGSNEKFKIQLDCHQYSPMKLKDDKPSLERGIRINARSVTKDSNSNVNADHVSIYTDHVQEIKTIRPMDSKTKPKWTCVVRMDCGPMQTNKACLVSKLGKRGINYDVEPKGEHEVTAKTATQMRVTDIGYV